MIDNGQEFSDLGQISEIDIDLLQPNPLQPRGLITPDTLVELVDSIREHGILEPLVIAKTPAGFQIIAGERRWRAAKLAGFTKVPAVIRETSAAGLLEMALVENVQRQDLNSLERAQAFKRLIDEFEHTPTTISKKVAKSIAFVSNTLRLLALPDAVKDALIAGSTTEGHARALVSLDSDEQIVEALKEVLSKNLSVRATEELVRKIKVGSPKQTWKDSGWTSSEEIEQIEKDLAEYLSRDDVIGAVKVWQSRVAAKILVKISGTTEKTTQVLQKIRNALMSV